jgi:hypothetical protein
MSEKNASGAVIICSHCANGRYPILLAERSNAEDDPVDTGWQFVCNVESHEDVADAKVWALDEVLELEPSLREFMDLPTGTRLVRLDKNSPWQAKTDGN